MKTLSLLLIASLGAQACVDSGPCNDIGCSSGFHWQRDVAFEGSEVAGAEVEVCRDDTCVLGPIPGIPTEPGVGMGTTLEGGAGVQVEVTLWLSVEGDLSLQIWWPLDKADKAESHSYRLRIKSSEDETLMLAETGRIVYEREYPNGPKCPGSCRRASLDQRQ